MLMQNFKSAADLEITGPQKEALMKTLVLLETGKLTHVAKPPVPDSDPSPKFTGRFNMAAWTRKSVCGTVCCIGGTAEVIGGVHFGNFSDNKPLIELFYADKSKVRLDDIAPAQAATALRSYLTTGDAKWSEAVRT